MTPQYKSKIMDDINAYLIGNAPYSDNIKTLLSMGTWM
jgi:hypothetical protein